MDHERQQDGRRKRDMQPEIAATQAPPEGKPALRAAAVGQGQHVAGQGKEDQDREMPVVEKGSGREGGELEGRVWRQVGGEDPRIVLVEGGRGNVH